MLALAWFFYVYQSDPASLQPVVRVQGPYATLWLCLDDVVSVERDTRWRLIPGLCFQESQ